MEHLAHVAEAVLAIFGSMKFMHECYELVHHLMKMKIVVKLLK
jgi:hypothetical protein